MLFALDEWVLVGRAAEYFAALACGSKLYVLMYVVSMYNNPNQQCAKSNIQKACQDNSNRRAAAHRRQSLPPATSMNNLLVSSIRYIRCALFYC